MWIASTADGGTVRQEDVKDELSGWQKLLRSDKKLTQLRLQLWGMTVIGIPKADGYVYAAQAEVTWNTGKSRVIREGIGSVIGEAVVMTWIDESRNIWSEVKTLEEFRVIAKLN